MGAIANSLLFEADGEPVLVLTSGAHRVDTAAVAERIGVARLKRADPDFVSFAASLRAAIGQQQTVEPEGVLV